MSDRERRTAVLMENLPLVLAVILVLFYVGMSLQPTDEHGRTWTWHVFEWLPLPLEWLLGLVLLGVATAFVAAFFMFFISGIGWMIAGHTTIGLTILVVRGFVSLWLLGYLVEGGSSSVALTSFVASVAMAVGSALALALVTRPGAGGEWLPAREA